ncbi:hypothetical protein ACWV95_31000 [Streptomyces albus]
MDLDAVTDELYGLPPEDFTAVRDRRAQEARKSGDRELSGRIRRLRRPTLAAWACNLLVRDRPEETRLLLELGEELRRAHRDLETAHNCGSSPPNSTASPRGSPGKRRT